MSVHVFTFCGECGMWFGITKFQKAELMHDEREPPLYSEDLCPNKADHKEVDFEQLSLEAGTRG